MSTGVGEPQNSRGLIEDALSLVSPRLLSSLSGYQINALNKVLRKSAHFTEYMILALLAVRAFQFGHAKLRWRSFFGALALSALYAVSDELHQRLVPGRSAAALDVLIDSSGAFICMGGILLWFGIKRIERELWGGMEPDGGGK